MRAFTNAIKMIVYLVEMARIARRRKNNVVYLSSNFDKKAS